MDVTDISPHLEQLDEDLDSLQDVLKPLLGDIGDISSKLPLLDRAKLHIVIAYAIESLLFSSLRLNSVDTKNHAVFTELTRVRQYFDKIKAIETPAPARGTTLNTQAAIRFLKNDLYDNKGVVDKLKEQLGKEKQAKEQPTASREGATAKKRRSEGPEDSNSEQVGEKRTKKQSHKKAKK